jgi:hypothetical protein
MTLTKQEYKQLLADAIVCEDSGHVFDDTMSDKWRRKSIDRIDNTRGYEAGNVRVVTYKANIMRGDIPLNAWKAAAAVMRAQNLWAAILKSE